MQYTVKSKVVRHEATFVIVITGAVSHFPVLGGLQTRANTRRMGHAVLEQVAGHASAAKAVTVIKAKGPLEHFVLAQLRGQTAIEFTAPAKALREVVTPVNEFRHLHLVRVFGELVVHAMASVNREQVIRQNLEAERRCDVRELQRVCGKVIRDVVASRKQATCTVLVFHCLRRVALGRIGRMAHHLQILDIKVVVDAKANRLLFNLVRSLPQERMRREFFHGIDFRCIRVRHTRRQHMSCARKAAYFRNPNTIKFCVGRNAVIVVVCHLAVFIVFGVKAHVALAVLQRIFRVDPTRSSPVTGKGRTRRDVDDIEQRA